MAVDFQNKVAPYKPKKDEEYMNAKQLDHFRKILAAVKSELSHDIDRTVQMMQDEATIFADPNDRASQESDMALELRNRDRERKLIKKIDETLDRIYEDFLQRVAAGRGMALQGLSELRHGGSRLFARPGMPPRWDSPAPGPPAPSPTRT